MAKGIFPGGKTFAFTILDDTDQGTVVNLTPVYRLLESLGFRTTKTVWPLGYEGSSAFMASETCEDPDYCAFVRDLQQRGFEIAFHGASMASSTRQRTLEALERFRELFGEYPRIHVNHSFNRDNIYWGSARVDNPLLKWLYQQLNGAAPAHYQGHIPGSDWWWGDACFEHIAYVRNLTFADPNVLRSNPSLPYHDPRRPLVRSWFSAVDAENVEEFNALLNPRAQDRLVSDGGVCIVATHLGKDFAPGGAINHETKRLLTRLASLPGWFPTTGELLDWLRHRRPSQVLPQGEWAAMQWRWARDLVARKIVARLR